MFKKAVRKLNSNSGASILLALIFFATVTMVVSVILSAASTSSKSITADKQQQQYYLTDSSTALLLHEELDNGSVMIRHEQKADGSDNGTFRLIEETDYDWRRVTIGDQTLYERNLFPDEYNLLGTENKDGTGDDVCAFAPLVQELLEEVLAHSTEETYTAERTFSLKVNHDKLETVYLDCKMDEDYHIRITLSNRKDDQTVYQMTISIPAHIEYTMCNFSSDSSPHWYNIEVITWPDYTILRGNRQYG